MPCIAFHCFIFSTANLYFGAFKASNYDFDVQFISLKYIEKKVKEVRETGRMTTMSIVDEFKDSVFSS